MNPASALICEAVRRRVLLEFDYDGLHRVVQPYRHGIGLTGRESLRAIQIAGQNRGKQGAAGKLWTVSKMVNLSVSAQSFLPDDVNDDPQDSAFESIDCAVR
jgi:hypothetical protein